MWEGVHLECCSVVMKLDPVSFPIFRVLIPKQVSDVVGVVCTERLTTCGLSE